jgi:hypothetical protein
MRTALEREARGEAFSKSSPMTLAMDAFIGFFVQHPLRVAGLAVAYLVIWGIVRATGNPRNALLVPAFFCLAFAAWEGLVTARSPEANIRVDLLLIWPVLGLLTLWALFNTFRRT